MSKRGKASEGLSQNRAKADKKGNSKIKRGQIAHLAAEAPLHLLPPKIATIQKLHLAANIESHLASIPN
jgi:hypothetical protein